MDPVTFSMDSIKGTLWALVLFPTIVTTFKDAVARWYNEASVYLIRPFDTDRDPNTPEICRVTNADGKRELVVIHRYKYFGLSAATRGVWYSYVTDNGEYCEDCHVTLTEWGKFLKTSQYRKTPAALKGLLQDKGVLVEKS